MAKASLLNSNTYHAPYNALGCLSFAGLMPLYFFFNLKKREKEDPIQNQIQGGQQRATTYVPKDSGVRAFCTEAFLYCHGAACVQGTRP